MFYCNKCAKKNKWPESIGKSRGMCECCGKSAVCNDTPSRYLPDPPRSKSDKKKA